MSSELTQYDEMATRHNAAYAAFRTIYEAKSPAPTMPTVERDSIFVPIALVVMIVASVIVSGSRTIIEFGGGLVGVSAFVMLEGAIVAYAFFHTRTDFQESRINDVRKLAKIGLVLAFAVAVAANIHAVLKERGVDVDGRVNTVILIAVAISAPALAFISGDIMALETLRNSHKTRRVKEAHQKALTEWMDGLNTAWTREKSRWGVKIEVSRADSPTMDSPQLSSAVRPADMDTDTDGRNYSTGQGYNKRTDARTADMDTDGRNYSTGQGYNKRTDARTAIWAHLEQNPPDAELKVRELAEKIGVGKSTVAEVLKEYRMQKAANRERERTGGH